MAFVTILVYLAIVVQVLLGGFFLLLLFRKKFSWAEQTYRWIQKRALLIAAIGATIAMSGSLYFSEVNNWTPCLLCWYQRIAIFPMVFLLWPAYVKKFKDIATYTLPLAITGFIIAGYHYFIQLMPSAGILGCEAATGVSCIGRYMYGTHMTIPGMAVTVLAVIITMVIVYKKQ